MSMNKPDIEQIQRAVATSLHEHWVLFLVEGIILIILGLAAVVIPPIATLAVEILYGWLFLISGIVGLITTFRMRQAPGFGWSLVSAILGIAVGIVEFKYQWFEAGEALEDLLYPVKGSKQRVAKLMKSYLPERRIFWARLCAISALAMRGDEKTRHSPWKQLALVGRDIASDMPLDQIPLMKQVAEISVRAFESRL